MENVEVLRPPLNPVAAQINKILLNDELPRFGKMVQLMKLITKENVEMVENYLKELGEYHLLKKV